MIPFLLSVLLLITAGATGPVVDLPPSGLPHPRERGGERPELGRFFDSAGVDGCFLLLDEATDRTTRYNAERCARRFSPASTFKIPNSLIGLETGVLTDAEHTYHWDGTRRSIDAWNRDHDLRSAFRHSVVWYYQQLARAVGRQRMQRWVDTLGYGSRTLGDAIDLFWLDGSLTISAEEQVDFLRRLRNGRLPVSARSVAILRDIMVYEDKGGAVMFAKTGWALRTGANVGWLVGWIERGDTAHYFAMNITGAADDRDIPRKRVTILRAILAELKIWE